MRKAMEKKKFRGSPASEESAFLYVRDTTNSENFKAHIFFSIKKRIYYSFCFYFIRLMI